MKKSMQTWLAAATLGLAIIIPCAGTPAFAAETPQVLAGGKVISIEEAKKLVDAKSASFVDTRAVLNYGKGHVPGAIAVAYREKSAKAENFDATQDQLDLSKLPQDKNAQVVFYSDGPTGWKSYKASVLAIRAGYKNVMYMRGGFAEWIAKKFPVES